MAPWASSQHLKEYRFRTYRLIELTTYVRNSNGTFRIEITVHREFPSVPSRSIPTTSRAPEQVLTHQMSFFCVDQNSRRKSAAKKSCSYQENKNE